VDFLYLSLSSICGPLLKSRIMHWLKEKDQDLLKLGPCNRIRCRKKIPLTYIINSDATRYLKYSRYSASLTSFFTKPTITDSQPCVLSHLYAGTFILIGCGSLREVFCAFRLIGGSTWCWRVVDVLYGRGGHLITNTRGSSHFKILLCNFYCVAARSTAVFCALMTSMSLFRCYLFRHKWKTTSSYRLHRRVGGLEIGNTITLGCRDVCGYMPRSTLHHVIQKRCQDPYAAIHSVRLHLEWLRSPWHVCVWTQVAVFLVLRSPPSIITVCKAGSPRCGSRTSMRKDWNSDRNPSRKQVYHYYGELDPESLRGVLHPEKNIGRGSPWVICCFSKLLQFVTLAKISFFENAVTCDAWLTNWTVTGTSK
jgi:hypothetical protein